MSHCHILDGSPVWEGMTNTFLATGGTGWLGALDRVRNTRLLHDPVCGQFDPVVAFGVFRAGYHQAPGHADGRITLAGYPAARSDNRTPSDCGQR
ncbi:hypothetical protein GCM10023194_51820 [Planotetraspora phitsanulokensis]|uniref:Uncharacterized protein n=1 Tax=Planotetraspora phitsanulokensis TaxID=575192 RepID=A0A8J3U855_9ACTN|nr:hypothetical protein Pph01_48390 [Planotetraspora phitsanulokensis]